MKLAVVVLAILGCLAAGAAAMLVNVATEPKVEREIEVLVATKDLSSLSILETSHLKQVRVAKTAVAHQQGRLVDPVEVVGRVLSRRVSEGQLITASCLLPDEGSPVFSTEIPEGMRACTVSFPGSSVLRELLYPHCRVDIYGVFDLRRDTEGEALGTEILQDVEVLAVEYEHGHSDATAGEQNRARRSNSVRVTFALTPDQVKALQLALRKGQVCLALRNPRDKGIRQPTRIYITAGTYHGALPQIAPPSDSDLDADQPDKVLPGSEPKQATVEVILGPDRTLRPISSLDPTRMTEYLGSQQAVDTHPRTLK